MQYCTNCSRHIFNLRLSFSDRFFKKKKRENEILQRSPVLLLLSLCSSSCTLDVLRKIGLLYRATGSGHRILIGFHLDRFTQSWMYCRWLLREFSLKDWIAPQRPRARQPRRAGQHKVGPTTQRAALCCGWCALARPRPWWMTLNLRTARRTSLKCPKTCGLLFNPVKFAKKIK